MAEAATNGHTVVRTSMVGTYQYQQSNNEHCHDFDLLLTTGID